MRSRNRLPGHGCLGLATGVGAIAALLAAVALAHPSAARAHTHCDGIASSPLCRSFAAFRRTPAVSDRLPATFRDAPPFRHVDPRSSRRVGPAKKLAGREFFLAAGKRLVCLVAYAPSERGGSFGCNSVGDALAGRMFMQQACLPGRYAHRLLLGQLLPDGVRSVAVHRVGQPAVTVPVRRNLVALNLPVPSRDYLPDGIQWSMHGVTQTRSLLASDMDVTCHAPASRVAARSDARR